MSTYFGGPQITAFKDPENRSFAIVAVNSGRTSVSETLSLNGFSTKLITPWITSASLSLAEQAPISVSGTSFTFKLPASSVTTFAGTVTKIH